MSDKKTILIKCPCCGAEYLPGEIYLPKHFLGQPTYEERDCDHKILCAAGVGDVSAEMDLDERFVCEKCLTPFFVHANVSFTTQIDELSNPNTSYSTSIKAPIFNLQED